MVVFSLPIKMSIISHKCYREIVKIAPLNALITPLGQQKLFFRLWFFCDFYSTH